jgi:hypothetical protein
MGIKTRLFGWLINGVSSKVRDLENEQEQLELEIIDITSQNLDLSSRIEELTTDRNLWRDRHDRVSKKSRNLQLEWETDRLQPVEEERKHLREQISKSKEDEIEDEPERDYVPNSISEVLLTAEQECENLMFFEDAKRSARKCIYKDTGRLLDLLRVMDEAAQEWFDQEAGSGSFEDILRGKGGIDIAPAESDTAHQTHPRVFKTAGANGKQVKMEMVKHIKLGIQMDPEKTMRIHYEANRKYRKIQIGHCGKHLPVK